MKRRRILWLLAFAAVAAGIVLFWPRGPKEPVYQGKRLSAWLEQMMQQTPGTSLPPITADIRADGTNAVPFLLSEFSRTTPKWQTSFNTWAAKRPAVGYRFPDERKRIYRAAFGFHLLGSNAVPALPVLAGYLGDPQRSHAAMTVMSGPRIAGLPYLLRALASTNAAVAQAAASGLSRMAVANESATKALVELLQHGDGSMRSIAASSLRLAHARVDLAASALADALTDPDSKVQWVAEQSLIYMGPRAKAAVPELQRLAKFSTGRYERMASNALFHIDPAALPPQRPSP